MAKMTKTFYFGSQNFRWYFIGTILIGIFVTTHSAIAISDPSPETVTEIHDSTTTQDAFESSSKKKRSTDGFETFMMTHGYDPYSAWGKRSMDPNQMAYLESIGYNPYFMFKKRNDYYSQDETSPYNGYQDVFYPHHFFHGFKRSPYYRRINQASPSDEEVSPVRRKREAVFGSPKSKRLREMTSNGFHGDTFSNGFGDFSTMKKRRFGGMDASGFHGDIFSDGFGDFSTMKKRRPEMDAMGFYGDTFSNGFGDFQTMKKNQIPTSMSYGSTNLHNERKKRSPEMTSSGFYGDTFSNGFGDFYTMKRGAEAQKRRPEMTSSGFYGDMFTDGFGDFYTMKRNEQHKRKPEMTSSGFYGDMFTDGFGDFYTMKRNMKEKRRPEMSSNGFHGDMFSSGFGDFYPMKRNQYPKRIPEMTSSGFHGDTFSDGFGDFYTMKKRLQGWDALNRSYNKVEAGTPQSVGSLQMEKLNKETSR